MEMDKIKKARRVIRSVKNGNYEEAAKLLMKLDDDDAIFIEIFVAIEGVTTDDLIQFRNYCAKRVN